MGGQEREEGGEGRGMSVRLLIRVFVFHYWVKSREECEEKRGGRRE